ncbi:hypothetical protein [Geodermatophilus sp. SYSU D01036]
MTGGRAPFAHDAVLAMGSDGDERAPGGAITVALCGGWSHDGPCPLASHHTSAERQGDRVRLRVLFAAPPAEEGRVRTLIRAALLAGEAHGPDGATASWRLVGEEPGVVRDEERAHLGRLLAG